MTTWKLFALASAFFAGLTAIFGKLGVAELNSNLATLIRTLVIIALIASIVTWRGEWQWPRNIALRPILFLLLSGVATGLSWLFYYRALQMAPASLVAPIDKLSVVFAIILSVAILGEPLSWKVMAGGGLVTAGALVLAWPAS